MFLVLYTIYIIYINREGNDAEKELPTAPSLKDEIKRLPVIQVSGKAKGLDLVIGRGNELRVSNSIRQIYIKSFKICVIFYFAYSV